LGFELETVRNVALVIVVLAVLLAGATAVVVKAIIGKMLSVLVLGGLAVIVWSQRTSLQDCADRVGATLGAGAVDDSTCTFFGRDVTISSPLGD
jgi:hypothetical protein